MKSCPKCKASVSDTAKFCIKCGFNIKKHEEENSKHFCPECGTEFSGGNFCPECGYDISKDLEPVKKTKAKKDVKKVSFDEIDLDELDDFLDQKIKTEKVKINKNYTTLEVCSKLVNLASLLLDFTFFLHS